MSDLLAFSNRIMAGGDIELPRYYDLIHGKHKEQETPEQVISRFDKLRRKKE
jgi:hypothetical protein